MTADATGHPPVDPSGLTPPPPPRQRAGRNLPAAIAVGVSLVAVLAVGLLLIDWVFVLLVAVGLSLGAWEVCGAVAHLGMRPARIPVVVGTALIVLVTYLSPALPTTLGSTGVMLAVIGLTMIAALVWRMPQGPDGFVRDASSSLFVIAYVPLLGSFASLMIAHPDGPERVLTFVLIVVAGDLFGYAVGLPFGKHQMSPTISPKKSWEGFAGSLVGGVLVGVICSIWLLDSRWWVGLVLGVALVLVGVCGDLVESLIKRDVGIKDMSSILPGHGGVMDRLDSLLLAAPVAWVLTTLLVPPVA